MDLANVTRFLAVLDYGTFAKAAETVGVTPQAVAFSITKLERELDVTLFERASGGLTKPTEYAFALEDYARTTVLNERQAVQAVQSVKKAETGWLRLGVGETMNGSTIVPLISQMIAERPDVNIALIENYTDRLIERMMDGDIDMIAGAPVSGIDHAAKLTQHVLFEASDIIVARQSHPLAGQQNVNLADMQRFTWIVPNARRDTYYEIMRTYHEAKLTPPQSFIFSDAPTIGEALLRANNYLILVPPHMVTLETATDLVRIDAPRPAPKRVACLIYPSNRSLSAVARMARDSIIDVHATDPARAKISI